MYKVEDLAEITAEPVNSVAMPTYLRSAVNPSRSTVEPVFLSVKIRSSGIPAMALSTPVYPRGPGR